MSYNAAVHYLEVYFTIDTRHILAIKNACMHALCKLQIYRMVHIAVI